MLRLPPYQKETHHRSWVDVELKVAEHCVRRVTSASGSVAVFLVPISTLKTRAGRERLGGSFRSQVYFLGRGLGSVISDEVELLLQAMTADLDGLSAL